MLKQLAIGAAALFVTTGAALAECPRYTQPVGRVVTLTEGFWPDPVRYTVTAGGEIDLQGCQGVYRTGFVASRPDFVFDYRARNGVRSVQKLTFRVESADDTVLLIKGPDGRWLYNDDGAEGLNAKVSIPQARDGRYAVWVGTFGGNRYPSAKLAVTELD